MPQGSVPGSVLFPQSFLKCFTDFSFLHWALNLLEAWTNWKAMVDEALLSDKGGSAALREGGEYFPSAGVQTVSVGCLWKEAT